MRLLEFKDFDFDNKEDAFKALFSHQERIINSKKSCVYKSSEKGSSNVCFYKALESMKGVEGAKEGFIYPIISTTKFMDSHNDVHFNGCFNKTVKEQQGKVKYILDHNLKFDSVIAWQKDVKLLKKTLDWETVGKNYEGDTEGLVFEIEKSKIKRLDVLEAIENKVEDFENSIRMQYIKIRLGLNSGHKSHKKNKEYWNRKIDSIANKEIAEELGYFWGVEDLKIIKEGSLVVAGGSNSATSIYEAVSVDTSQEKRDPTEKKWFY